mgnify:CR=1 FL=1
MSKTVEIEEIIPQYNHFYVLQIYRSTLLNVRFLCYEKIHKTVMNFMTVL